MIEYKQAIFKPIKFKYFQITKDILNKTVQDTERADDHDLRLEKPVNTWKVIKQYQGLVYEEKFGLHFLQDYGTVNQIANWDVDIGDYVVESSDGHTSLIKESTFNRLFKIVD